MNFITTLLENIKINKNQSFINYYENTFKPASYPYNNHKLLDNLGSKENTISVIDFLTNVYIAGYNNPSITEHLKTLYDGYPDVQSYILLSIQKISNEGLKIFPLKYSVFESSEISETSLLILERIIKEKDKDGNYCIDNALIEKKFSYLVNNLHKEEYTLLRKIIETPADKFALSPNKGSGFLSVLYQARLSDVVSVLSFHTLSSIQININEFYKGLTMIYGYCRISTEHQVVSNQKHGIQTFADDNNLQIDKWVEETISSRKHLNERKLGKLLKKLQKGDILIATELSRLGRNLLEVMGILQNCLEKGCQIWTLKENYRLGADIQSKVLAFAFSLASEIERQLISDRTRESLKRVRAEGKHIGRPKGSTYRKLAKKHNKIVELLEKKVSKAEIARLLDCDWNTLHRYIQECIIDKPKIA